MNRKNLTSRNTKGNKLSFLLLIYTVICVGVCFFVLDEISFHEEVTFINQSFEYAPVMENETFKLVPGVLVVTVKRENELLKISFPGRREEFSFQSGEEIQLITLISPDGTKISIERKK